MAKVLISSVGTGSIKKDSDGDYQKTVYILDGKEYEGSLTSQVIVEHYGIEKIYFIGTNKSMWDNLYIQYGGEDEEYFLMLSEKKEKGTLEVRDLERLEKLLDKILKKTGSKCFFLKYDKNDTDEIWGNFTNLLKIQKLLQNEDRVVLDITHGFRYMPIFNIFKYSFETIVPVF